MTKTKQNSRERKESRKIVVVVIVDLDRTHEMAVEMEEEVEAVEGEETIIHQDMRKKYRGPEGDLREIQETLRIDLVSRSYNKCVLSN